MISGVYTRRAARRNAAIYRKNTRMSPHSLSIEYARKQAAEQNLKKDWKKCKKGVDRRLILWYYVRVVSERCSRATQILENDTESRRTRVWFFGVTFKRDSQFEMSFELEGKTLRFNTGFNTRVWSWLRTNAGGVPNTCKSSGDSEELALSYSSGGRVSNAWATCLLLGDNASKDVLIPRKTTVPHGTGVKGAIR